MAKGIYLFFLFNYLIRFLFGRAFRGPGLWSRRAYLFGFYSVELSEDPHLCSGRAYLLGLYFVELSEDPPCVLVELVYLVELMCIHMASAADEGDPGVGRFTSDQKEMFAGVSGVTITTYTMVAFAGRRSDESQKVMEAIAGREWGLLLLDEVHVVPAQMFRKVLRGPASLNTPTPRICVEHVQSRIYMHACLQVACCDCFRTGDGTGHVRE